MSLDPIRDYEFGWRWLLPVQACSACRLFGFSAEEEAFWGTAPLALPSSVRDGRGDVLLVNCDKCVQYTKPTDLEVDSASVVCIIANRSCARQWRARLAAEFPQFKEYGLLPESMPRVIIPLATPHLAVTALGLHRPGRWVARLGVGVARMLARVGNFSLLRGRVLLIASRGPERLPLGSVLAEWPARGGGADGDYALYLGTPDDNRKTVVVPLGLTAPDVILKVATLDKARASLRNEADVLAVLAASPLANHTPKLVGVVDAGAILTIYQEYRRRKAVKPRQMREAVVSFLGGLSRMSRQGQPLARILAEIPMDACSGLSDEVASACRSLYARLASLADSGTLLWVHRSHGDFAPWNCSWSAQGFFVFDWEASRAQDLAFGDVFYYVVAPALLVQRNPSAQGALQSALRLARQVAESGDMTEVDCRIYLAIWLLGRAGEGSLYGDLSVLLERNWL